MKRAKKLFAVVVAFVMTFAFSLQAFAAKSPIGGGVVSNTVVSATSNGAAVAFRMLDSKDQALVASVKSEETLKTVLGNQFDKGMEVVAVKEASADKYPVTVTFNTTGVTEKTVVKVLSWDGSKWTVLDGVKVGKGTVTLTLDKEAKLAFVFDKDTVVGSTSVSSPSTGEVSVLPAAMIAVVALAFVAVLRRKEA